jgi:hypothetical protein
LLLILLNSCSAYAQCTTTVNDLNGLLNALNTASPNDIICLQAGATIDVSTANLPINIPPGVTLTSQTGGWKDVDCPKIISYKRWKNSANNTGLEEAFIFRMLPCTSNCATVQPTTISNLIIQNEEYHWQDFNQDNFLSGGVFIESTCRFMGVGCYNNCSALNNPAGCSDCPDCIGRNFLIDNCEIFRF